jgi:two-component system sensor histidine kinase UhpB
MENNDITVAPPDLKQAARIPDKQMVIFAADTLRLMANNEAFRQELQYPQATLNSMTITDLLGSPDDEKFPVTISEMQTAGVNDFRLNTCMQRQDGSRFPAVLELSPLQLQNSAAIFAIMQSSQHQTTTQVSEREARLEHIVSKVPGLLFQMRQGSTGLIQFSFLSDACENLLGITPQSLYANARQLFAQIVDEDRESWSTQLRDSAEKLEVLSWEGRIRIDAWKDIKWISLRATPEDDGNNGIQWTGLMTNISRSKGHEHALRQSRAELADLYVYMNHEQEEEHTHIQQTLHDDLGGNLSALKMMLTHLWETGPDIEEFLAQKPYIEKLISRSLLSLQQIATEIRPGILDAGIVAALDWLAKDQENQTGIHYEIRCNAEEIPLDPALATSLFRIVQAACANIREYAQASAAEIHLYDGCSELLMEIIDNGKGYPAATPSNTPLNYRLREMRERIALLGGSFSMASRPGKGMLISLRVPLPEKYAIES